MSDNLLQKTQIAPDLIERSKAIELLEAFYHDCPRESVQRAILANIAAAICDLPAASVSDEMVERACKALTGHPRRESIRAAIEAAMGHGE